MPADDITVTPFQKKVLKQYQLFQHQPPSVRSLIALSARSHILAIVLIVSAAVLCFSVNIAPVGFAVIGMLVGALCRDLGQFHKLTHAWCVLSKVINWQSLNALLSGSSPNDDA